MLLFSTILPIKETLTKDKFIELIIKWNQNSPHKENIISGIKWNGERNIRYESECLWLEIQEYRNKNIISVRYEKIAEDGVIWNTDYVMNFDEMKMCIRLDRSYKEDALAIGERFSTPYFITMLIQNEYLEKDAGLPILKDPIFINEDNANTIVNLINGNVKYSMPVVYVSKTFHNFNPLNVNLLSNKLKGIAHVLVQENMDSNNIIRNGCAGKNEYDGAIGIYYPNAVGHKRFIYRRASGQDDNLLKKIVRYVIQYSIEQNVDTLYTWQGVNNALLEDKLRSQINQRVAAELDKEKTKVETDKLLDAFDDDMESLKKKVEELTRSNEVLRNEAEWLRAKLSADAYKKPVIYLGEEDDFYPGEIKDLLLSVLEDALNNSTGKKTRRADIIRDIIENNDYQHMNEDRQKTIKNILKGYTHVNGSIKQTLKDLGFEISEDGKHYKLMYFGDRRYWTTITKTPSDVRVGNNVALTICRDMF